MTTITWLKTNCAICGREYRYPKIRRYQPKTCGSLNCLHKWLHDPRCHSLQCQIDKSQLAAGI